MDLVSLSIELVPQLDVVPAAYGAINAPLQISGGTVFDIVIAVIVSAS
ncbi:hypothetical protein GV829_13815 [Sphingomonas lacunae]|uniref:Uncharacterized protein n=1 Tax=Sphingomonas lacunae TaxID=2698828 RepID=A0A6M4AYE8_9SPHN|nr:hypothetical protein [Sphingomonas lacunae]QJQ33380.1 hypothetical protein GV829_13815 [Sphingomonas lacunae]